MSYILLYLYTYAHIYRLEFLDEVEEFYLLMAHYSYTISCNYIPKNTDSNVVSCYDIYNNFMNEYKLSNTNTTKHTPVLIPVTVFRSPSTTTNTTNNNR